VILFVFEIIREVGVRMPRAVGDAVSIVAGIILGDAAIKAGIASAPVIMVAAISATCSFIDPPIMNSLPLLRIINLVFARIFGLFGVAFFIFALAGALCVKTTCGFPYLSPFSPLRKSGLVDGILVVPDVALLGAQNETKEEEA
jgi:spore germination protein KA